MMEDLEFLVGDPTELRGRAIVFVENEGGSDHPFNPRFPALAVASDPSELLELISSVFPLPEEMRSHLLQRIKQFREMWSRTMFGESMFRSMRESLTQDLDHSGLPEELIEQVRGEVEQIKDLPDEPMGDPFHGCFLPLVGFDPGVIEPYEQSCDVMRARSVPSITYAGLVLSGFAQHYLAEYLLQREAAVPDAPEAEPRKEKVKPSGPDVRSMPTAQFLELLNRMVSELMFARETGAPIEKQLAELKQITKGTVFIRDVLNLAGFVETEHPNRIAIIDLYLRRIGMLAQERYEDIPSVDRRIKELVEV
ncbi:MAG: hypothetical protein RL885_31575 [Planctomycetota bacterium]